MFNKILGKKETPQKDQRKPVKKSENSPSHGFICPICHLNFENQDVLFNHYSNIHQNNEAENSLNDEEIIDRSSLNATAEALLKRVSISANVTSDTESIQDNRSILSFNNDISNQRENVLEREISQLREKLILEEQSKLTMSHEYNQKLEDLNVKIKKLTKEKDEIEKKCESSLTDLDRIKQENEENKSIRINLSQIQEEYVNKCQEISDLQKELEFRPTVDDLNVLKKEIVQVQELSELIVKDKENQLKQLTGENKNLEYKTEKMEEDLKKTNSENFDLVNKCHELEKNMKKLEQKEKEYEKAALTNEEKIQKQELDIDDMNKKILDLKNDCDLKAAQIEKFVHQVKELNQEKAQLNKNISQLEEKKAELTNKLLNSESKSEDHNDLSDLIKEKEEFENELIKLRTKVQSLNEEKSEWLFEKNQFLELIKKMNDEIGEIKSLTKELENTNSNLESEKANRLALFAEIEKQRFELEEQFKKEKIEFEEILKDKEKFLDELTKNKKQCKFENIKNSLFETKSNLDIEVEHLKKRLDESTLNFDNQKAKIFQMEVLIESKNQELAKQKSQIIDLNENKRILNETKIELENKIKHLNEQILDHDSKNQAQKQEISNLEEQKLQIEHKCNEKDSEIKSLDEIKESILAKNSELSKLNASVSENNSKNETVITEFKRKIEKLNLTLNEKSQQLDLAENNEKAFVLEINTLKTKVVDLTQTESDLRKNILEVELEKDKFIQNCNEKKKELINARDQNINGILQRI
ncbi:early endosome antigen 1 [Brachionus plicatilis]|uniref:Early endosome antigen 1 n=1 Tax=Brachionus plicatilis TaxID=10195 RepID=A0A3M7T833_BRAPC|nr:early endosome antigen 1 [Brachionus plicatilis]